MTAYETAGHEVPERSGGLVISENGLGSGNLEVSLSEEIARENVRNPKELIAKLRKTLAEKDFSLLQSTLSNVELRQELELTQTRAVDLEKKVVFTQKANEKLTRRAADQAAATKGTLRSEADAARMEQQFRLAQKALEKEHARIRDELVVTKGELHRATQQLESQSRARRAEAAHASVKIDRLERQVSETASAASAAGAELSLSGARVKTRLAAAAGVAALVMLGLGVWSWYSGGSTVTAAASGTAAQRIENLPATDIHASKYVIPRPGADGSQTSNAQLVNARFGGSNASFQKALGRLNNALAGVTGHAPELLLREVRMSKSASDPHVCDFEWNGGQPALVYGGPGGATLDVSLNKCAAAVESYISTGAGTRVMQASAVAGKKNPGQ